MIRFMDFGVGSSWILVIVVIRRTEFGVGRVSVNSGTGSGGNDGFAMVWFWRINCEWFLGKEFSYSLGEIASTKIKTTSMAPQSYSILLHLVSFKNLCNRYPRPILISMFFPHFISGYDTL